VSCEIKIFLFYCNGIVYSIFHYTNIELFEELR